MENMENFENTLIGEKLMHKKNIENEGVRLFAAQKSADETDIKLVALHTIIVPSFVLEANSHLQCIGMRVCSHVPSTWAVKSISYNSIDEFEWMEMYKS